MQAHTYVKRPTFMERNLLIGCFIDFTHQKRPTSMKRGLHIRKEAYTYEKRPTHTKRGLHIRKETYNAEPHVWKQTHFYEKSRKKLIYCLTYWLVASLIIFMKRDLHVWKETCAYEKRLTMQITVYGHRLMLTKIERGKVLIYCLTSWLVSSLIVSMKRDLPIRKETFNADPHKWKQKDACEKSPHDLLLLWLHSWKETPIHEKRPTGAQYTWCLSFLIQRVKRKRKSICFLWKSSLFSLKI